MISTYSSVVGLKADLIARLLLATKDASSSKTNALKKSPSNDNSTKNNNNNNSNNDNKNTSNSNSNSNNSSSTKITSPTLITSGKRPNEQTKDTTVISIVDIDDDSLKETTPKESNTGRNVKRAKMDKEGNYSKPSQLSQSNDQLLYCYHYLIFISALIIKKKPRQMKRTKLWRRFGE